MSLYVLRHGETAWSRDRKHTGATDIPLDDEGERQAVAAGDVLRQLRGPDAAPFALVLVSPRSRAQRTAELAGFGGGEVDDRLVEWDYGDYEGRTTDAIHQERPGWLLWRDGCPHGEDADQVGARVDALLDERVRPVAADADVLLVAHSHLLRVLTARWLGLGPQHGSGFVLDAAGLGELGAEHELPAVLHWNLAPSV